MNKKDFFTKVAAAAPANMHGLYISVMLAQAALESGYGQSQLTQKYNNYFGILADSSWKDKKVTFSNGFTYRVYSNVRESVRDYVNFLLSNSRYKKAGVFGAKSPEEEARALQAANYAGSSTTYASKLISIINSNNLKQYDAKQNISTMSLLIGGIFAALYFAGEKI